MLTLTRRRLLGGLLGTGLLTALPARAGEGLRAAALEYSPVESLLALDLVPAGATDLAGYATFVNIETERLAGVAELGTRAEPSLEALRRLKPDVILGVVFRHAALRAKLEAIAPTVLLEVSVTATDGYAEMQRTFRTTADAVERGSAAEQVLASLEARLAEQADTLAARGLAGARVAYAQFLPGTPHLRIFNPESLPGQVFAHLGLVNAWQGPAEPFGFNTVGLEALAEAGEFRLLYVADPRDPEFRALSGGALWRSLPLGREGWALPLPPDTWPFGGPLSTGRLGERTAQALTDVA